MDNPTCQSLAGFDVLPLHKGGKADLKLLYKMLVNGLIAGFLCFLLVPSWVSGLPRFARNDGWKNGTLLKFVGWAGNEKIELFVGLRGA